jgi:hypothetical protein
MEDHLEISFLAGLEDDFAPQLVLVSENLGVTQVSIVDVDHKQIVVCSPGHLLVAC